jgi:site-specific DNA-methyltransferase (adenine-specific)
VERPEVDTLFLGDNLDVITRLPDASFQLIYIDPPFNTGKQQTRQRITTVRAPRGQEGDRGGFAGKRYSSRLLSESSFRDQFDDYLDFIYPRLVEAHRLLAPTGSLYFHIDYREAHYCKLLLDEIFGRDAFLNEIIWAYDYGAKPNNRWPAKHDTIFLYVKDPKNYFFNNEEVEREPYMAPGLVTAEKAARGKLPTDTWWHTIVPTNGRERTGYATQKPEGLLRRMVQASSQRGDWCLDFFAGSGTLGAVCQQLGRHYVLVDESEDAFATMQQRLPVATPHRLLVAEEQR